MSTYIWKYKNFCGVELTDYEIENGYVSYATLARSFDCILNNNIIEVTGWENWEMYQGYNEDDYPEICQYYIISKTGYEILTSYTDEIIYYNDELNMYVWGVTHFGTSWDYVLTDIKLELD